MKGLKNSMGECTFFLGGGGGGGGGGGRVERVYCSLALEKVP